MNKIKELENKINEIEKYLKNINHRISDIEMHRQSLDRSNRYKSCNLLPIANDSIDGKPISPFAQ